jgi:hypothetical protein
MTKVAIFHSAESEGRQGTGSCYFPSKRTRVTSARTFNYRLVCGSFRSIDIRHIRRLRGGRGAKRILTVRSPPPSWQNMTNYSKGRLKSGKPRFWLTAFWPEQHSRSERSAARFEKF